VADVSETAQRTPTAAGGPPGEPAAGGSPWSILRRVGTTLARQREATVFVVVVLLILYFGVISSAGRATFFTKIDLINVSQIAAAIIIISLGEVLLLICGEIDLSVGFVYTFAPFVMYYMIHFYGVPPILAIVIALLVGVVVGWVNAFLTVTVGLPSFITTLGTGFVLLGLTLTTAHAQQAPILPSVVGIGHWIGSYAWAEIIWAVALLAVFHTLLTRTRWGLHTIAVGGNQLAAKEAGVNVARIKYGNFMLTSLLGAFVGLQVAFQTSIIDPSAGGYQPMFYAVAAAVIGGTAMLGGSGTMIGAFLGSMMLAVLQDGFSVLGISANPLPIIFGGAILVAMIANIQLARLRERGRLT
jgi:simple sugar transport system permease protein